MGSRASSLRRGTLIPERGRAALEENVYSVRLTRGRGSRWSLPAPIEVVFAAWTDPETMARWLSPMGHAEVEADVRVGASFRLVVVGGDMRIEHAGK
jgi:hypothetical protein